MDNEIDEFLADAAARPAGNEVTISIRDFIGKWGAKRRGYWYVQAIQSDLDRHGMTTHPSFETGWIDTEVQLLPIQKGTGTPSTTAPSSHEISDDQATASEVSVALRVSSLPSASIGIISVSRDDTLSRAQALMLKHDYSQLAVLSGRELQGAISWESIAQARIHVPAITLRECIVTADAVGRSDNLLTHIPRIIDNGYVFVKDRDRSISGIITTADLSASFLELAGPYLLIGEVERRLRAIVDASFEVEVLESVRSPTDHDREIKGAKDLTLGEYIRLFDSREMGIAQVGGGSYGLRRVCQGPEGPSERDHALQPGPGRAGARGGRTETGEMAEPLEELNPRDGELVGRGSGGGGRCGYSPSARRARKSLGAGMGRIGRVGGGLHR